jgi:type II secretory pathway component PulC
MTSSWSGIRGISIAGLILLAAVTAWADEDQEGSLANEGEPARVVVQPPPFLVVGTVLSPETKVVALTILDDQGNSTRAVKLHEGDSVEGYRVAKIQMDQVLFERDGQTFSIRVGNDRQPAPRIAPAIPYQRRKEVRGEFVSPPDNIEEVRRQTDEFIQRLKGNPEFQKGLDQLRRGVHERLGTGETNP